MSRRDEALERAAMRHYAPRGLRTLDDYRALPGVAGVEDRGQRRITIYRERDLPLGALEHLQHDVDQRREVGTLIVWKVDRRQAERRRRSSTAEGFPPIPSDARWA
jgi:hypothetical protein